MEDQIVQLGAFLVWGVLGTAAFLVVIKAATGRINLKGLLQSSPDSGISPARVQLLFLTLTGAFGYLGIVVNALADPCANPCSLPPVPTEVLALTGGSNGLYLGAKGLIASGWLDRLR
jgi:hypothetical protein